MGNGWSFWLKEGTWLDVLYVGISDFEKAKKAAQAKRPNSEIEAFCEITPDVRRFLSLTDGKIIEAHVVNQGQM